MESWWQILWDFLVPPEITCDLIYLITLDFGSQLPHEKPTFAGTAICNQDIPSIISLIPFEQETFPSIAEFRPYNLHASVHWHVGIGIICCSFPQRKNEVKFFEGILFFSVCKYYPYKE